MKRLNLILTLVSLTAIVVSTERFSFTTKIILQPYSFLRLHEAVQIIAIILSSVIFSFFLLKELSSNFDGLKTLKGTLYGLIFIVGLYFFASGNALHEVSSFIFNNYCSENNFQGFCGSMFFNDYYFGNILFFIGLLLGNLSLILFERIHPRKSYTKKDLLITIANGLIYVLGIFVYAAFDRVVVGLVFSIIGAIVINFLFISSKQKFSNLPFTTYCVIAYTLGTFLSIIFRYIRF